MPPIKILYCIDNLIRGGTELQLIGLIERLDPTQYQPYLLTLRETDTQLTPKNCIHLHWQVSSLFSLQGIKALAKLIIFLRNEKISIVQTFFQDSTLFGGLAAYIARVPVRIACFRDLGFWYSKKQAFILRKVYTLMTNFICNAYVVKEHFSNTFNLDTNDMVVLRNGIDVKALPFVQHSTPVMHIGIVGNMTRQVKRTDLFIKAAGIIAHKHPNITWHIVGDGHLRTELEALAKERNVHDKIYFAGRVDQVADYLEKLDIGVLCSDSEGLSNALLEYMFKGVAAVATKVGGNPELIEHNQSGLLVPPNDEHALAQAIASLIENTELKNRLVNAAREKADQEYSWEKCIEAHDNLYQTLLVKTTTK